MRNSTPTNSTQTNVGSSNALPFKRTLSNEPASKLTAISAKVSINENDVIRRSLSGCSKPLGSCGACSSIPGVFTRLISSRATGPPIRPPSTRPKVAEAIASSEAEARPNFSVKVELHAAPVPWPPDSVIDPASRPISGSSPNAVARPIPMAFCTSSRQVTTSRNTTTTRPPFFRLAKSALKPMVAKNASINGVCNEVSNWTCISKLRNAKSAKATTNPPATGSGIL
ncbi:hypothetical protein D3C79_752360 [compost metagenome]